MSDNSFITSIEDNFVTSQNYIEGSEGKEGENDYNETYMDKMKSRNEGSIIDNTKSDAQLKDLVLTA